MKTAIVCRAEVRAGPAAPKSGICPACGEQVELGSKRGRWYYRHATGAGAGCSRRVKPVRKPLPRAVLPADEAAANLAMVIVERAVRAAQDGSLRAVLDLAFSPLVHRVLDAVQLAPEDVLDAALGKPAGRCEPAEVIVTVDEAAVVRALEDKPGPVLDVRSWHNGYVKELEETEWYVQLWPVGSAQAAMVRRVLDLAARVYVLGEPEEWKEVLAKH